MKRIILNLQIVVQERVHLPTSDHFSRWLEAVLFFFKFKTSQEVTIRIVDPDESKALNWRYRRQNIATNILSFPFEIPSINDLKISLLGDLVICGSIVEKEAQEQQKRLREHWAHMVIHGSLHLLGYDHITLEHAKHMEVIETQIMRNLGYSDPYKEISSSSISLKKNF
ncbi:MAG: rRNA maturation RNase YbeY [Candidatus Dasytiphilus stammeri]